MSISRLTGTSTSIPRLRHDIRTFQDAVERILQRFDVTRSDRRSLAYARQAVVDAYMEWPSKSNWDYYSRRALIVTEASYSTGTVAYDHTGGSYERQLTLTTGTWPTNAVYGSVTISNISYPIEKRISDTVVQLARDANPGEDIASGTSYSWYRDQYPLPLDYSHQTGMLDASQGDAYPIDYLEPGQAMSLQRSFTSAQSRAEFWTLNNDPRYASGKAIRFSPAPNSERTYELSYYAKGFPLYTDKYSEGTVSITADSTALTSSNATFTEHMQGAILRISKDGNLEPTPPEGYFDEHTDTYNPYVEQHMIHAVPTSSTLTLGDAASQSLSDVRYTISSWLDIDAEHFTGFLALAEFHYATYTRRSDVPTYKSLLDLRLREARERDYKPRSPATESDRRYMMNRWGSVSQRPE